MQVMTSRLFYLRNAQDSHRLVRSKDGLEAGWLLESQLSFQRGRPRNDSRITTAAVNQM